MKQQSSYEMDGESRDLLLFDYLEGNLTEEKTCALEEALATDPELCAELEIWKESFVVQDFYDIKVLEEQLVKSKSHSYTLSGPSAGFMLVLITALFSFLPVGEQKEKVAFHKTVSLPIPAAIAENVKVEEVAAEQRGVSKPIALQLPVAYKFAEALVLEETDDAATNAEQEKELPHLEKLVPVDAAASINDIQAVDIKWVKLQKILQLKVVSHKKQRQIRRIKEKALQQRKANEFFKGNRPYVVPLDTKNF